MSAIELFSGETEDGGSVIEATDMTSERELTIVVPQDGSAVYFVAKEKGRTRTAGLVVHPSAIIGLVQWLHEQGEMSTVEGIVIGGARP